MQRKDDFKEFYLNSRDARDIDPNIWMSNYIIDRMELNEEQILWFCFLVSITYQLPTAYMIINEYPDLENVGEQRLRDWWVDAQKDCPFQTDKLKQRKYLPDSVISYKHLVNGSQSEYFKNALTSDPYKNFDILFEIGDKHIEHFGRFSIWNWAQMLHQVAGLPILPRSLLLGENGTESHTHGICLALGQDEWAKKERYTDENGKRRKIVHKFSKSDKEYLENECREIYTSLLETAKDSDLYYIETVACAYKKLFRTRESRYIGYYLDRQAEDIAKTSKYWSGVDWDLLWQARREMLREELLHDSVDKSKFSWDYSDKLRKF